MDAIIVGLDLLVQKVKQTKMQKRLFLVTDGGSPCSFEDDLNVVIQQFSNLKCKFNLLTYFPRLSPSPSLPPHFPLEEEEESESVEREEREERRKKNKEELEKIVEKVKGVSVTVEEAIELMSYFRSRSVLSRPTFQGALEIGVETLHSSSLSLPISCFLKTKVTPFPSLKKLSLLSPLLSSSSLPPLPSSLRSPLPPLPDQNDPVEEEEQEEREVERQSEEEGEEGGKGEVKMKRRYECIMKPGLEIEKRSVSKGYRYGKTLVPFDAIDEAVSLLIQQKLIYGKKDLIGFFSLLFCFCLVFLFWF